MADSRIPSMLSITTLLLSCASAHSAFLPTGGRAICLHRPHRLSAKSDNINEGDKDADDELTFKRQHGSYQPIFHEPDPHYSYSEKLDDEDEDEMQSQLHRISWLPSLLSGRRRRRSTVRTENINGSAYNKSHSIELLPILPIPMIPSPQHDEIDDDSLSYGSGVWASSDHHDPSQHPFSSPAYLPHTTHQLSIAEPRYKRLYDDLISLGEYWETKRRQAKREARRRGIQSEQDRLPLPEETRRFIVTYLHPEKEGVLAEYGVLFQLRDLDEVAAIASYDDDEEILDITSKNDLRDLQDVLLDTHYEATHDVVGRVRIHRVLNPECWTDGVEEVEYLLGEASVIDLIPKSQRAKAGDVGSTKSSDDYQESGKGLGRVDLSEMLSAAKQLEARAQQPTAENVAEAVSRIREELRYAVDEAFTKQQRDNQSSVTTTTANNQIPLVPKGILIEKRPNGSLLQEEQSLRDSFAKLIALQQELKEKFRFTKDSIKSFGIGSIGMWLSIAAWSKFIDKRLEGAHMEMQEELQEKLLDYLSDVREEEYLDDANESDSDAELSHMEQESIDFDDLTPDLQQEFTWVQDRAEEELGPAALQRSIQIQCMIQAKDDAERLNLLKECVDEERRRLEAKKMVRAAVMDYEDDGEVRPKRLTRRQARRVFEKLIKEEKRDDTLFPEDAFQ